MYGFRHNGFWTWCFPWNPYWDQRLFFGCEVKENGYVTDHTGAPTNLPPPTAHRPPHTRTHTGIFCGIRRIEQFLTYTAQYIWTQCNETDISSLCISMVLFYFQYRRKQPLAFFSIVNIEENNRWHSKTRLVVNCCVPFLHSSYYEYNDFAPRTKIRFVKEWILYDHYVPDCLLLKRRYFWKCESSYSQ